MEKLERKTGMTREKLVRALSARGFKYHDVMEGLAESSQERRAEGSPNDSAEAPRHGAESDER